MVLLQVVHLAQLVFGFTGRKHGHDGLVARHLVGHSNNLAGEGDGVVGSLSVVVVRIDLIAVEFCVIFIAHLIDRITVLVADGTFIRACPQVADGKLAQFVLTLVFLYAEDVLATLGLADVHLRCGKVGLHKFGVVLILV